MLRKLTALFLALLMLFVFNGCTNNTPDSDKQGDNTDQGKLPDDTDGPDDGDTDPDDGEIDYYADLIKADYEGYDFRIFIRPGKVKDQYVEEETGETVDDAVYRRNQEVMNMFNITMSYTESPNSDAETGALNTILAGDDAYDIIFPHTRSSFGYAKQGALFNWNELENVHLDKPWWAQDIRENADIDGKLYVMDGDISMHSLQFANCMLFNKAIFDELGLDYPYQMVKDGTWTFDEFEKLVHQGAKDLNGDGVMTPGDDRYGYWTVEWGHPIAIIYTGGQRIYSKGADGLPYLSLYSEKTVDIFDRYFALTDSEDAFLQLTGKDANTTLTYKAPEMFRSDKTMFQDDNLGAVASYRDMESDFGILPLPKFTMDDEYATVINGHAHLVVVPKTISDPERTGAIIEALCAIGHKEVLPAFYETALQTKFTRDEESAEMIDIIRDSRVYDLGYVAGGTGTLESTGYNMSHSTTHDFSSYYAANESKALTALDDFLEAYAGIKKD